MVEKGHFEELQKIVSLVNSVDTPAEGTNRGQEGQSHSGRRRQTFVFSATLTFVHAPPKRLRLAVGVKKRRGGSADDGSKQFKSKDKVADLMSMMGIRKNHYKLCDITHRCGTAETLVEGRISCSGLEDKDLRLYYFLTHHAGRTLIFANSIDCVRRLYALLTRLGLTACVLHAKMHQKQRLKNLERFRATPKSMLIATDVAARGLDIEGVEHVVHYQVPRTAEIYVHRSGRTARASAEGLTVMLVDPADAANYRRICSTINSDKDLAVFPVDELSIDELRERVQLASKIDRLEYRLKRAQSSKSWVVKAAEEMELDLDDDELRRSFGVNAAEEQAAVAEQRRHLQSLERRLLSLLAMPVRSRVHHGKMPVTKYPTAADIREQQTACVEVVPKPIDVLRSAASAKHVKRAKFVGKIKFRTSSGEKKKHRKQKRRKRR